MAAHQPVHTSGSTSDSTGGSSNGRIESSGSGAEPSGSTDSSRRLAEGHPAPFPCSGSKGSDSAHEVTNVPAAATANTLSGSFSLREGVALPSLTSLSGSFGGAFWTVGASIASSGPSHEAGHTDCNSARRLAKPTLLGASFTGALDHLGSPAVQAIAEPTSDNRDGGGEPGLGCAMPVSAASMPRRVAGAAALLSFSSLGSSFSGTAHHAAFPLSSCIEALAAMSVDGSGSAFSSSGVEGAPSVPRPAGLWTALAESPMISGTSGFTITSGSHGSRVPHASSLFAASIAMPSPVGITSKSPVGSSARGTTQSMLPQPCVAPGVRQRLSLASNAESPSAARTIKRGRQDVATAAVPLVPAVRDDQIVIEMLPHAPELRRHDMVRRPVRPIHPVDGDALKATPVASINLIELAGALPLGKPLVRGNGQIITVSECQGRTAGACAEVICMSLVAAPQMAPPRSFDLVFHASVPLLSPPDAPHSTLAHVCWVDLDCSVFAVAVGCHVGLLHVNEVWPGDGPRSTYASAQWLPRRRQPGAADCTLVTKGLAMHEDEVRCLHVISRPTGDEYLLLSGGWDGVVWCSSLKWRHGRCVGFVAMGPSTEPRQVLCGSSPVSCIASGASDMTIVTTDDGHIHICGRDALCSSVQLLRSIDTGKPGLFACAPQPQALHDAAGVFGFGDGTMYTIVDGQFHSAVSDPIVSEIGAIELLPVNASLAAVICSGVGGVSLWLSGAAAPSTALTCAGSMPLVCQPGTPSDQTMTLDWHAVHGIDISVPAALFTYGVQPKAEAAISHVSFAGTHATVLVITDSLSGVAVYDVAAMLQRAMAVREAPAPLPSAPLAPCTLSAPLNTIQRACQFFCDHRGKTRSRFSTRKAATVADIAAAALPVAAQTVEGPRAGGCRVRPISQRAAAARAIQSLFANAAAGLRSSTESDDA